MDGTGKYLFLDMEWEQHGNQPSRKDKILEIGAVKSDDISSFMRYINPQKLIDKRILKLLKITGKQMFEEGITERQAVDELVDYAKDASVTIVWGDAARVKLENLAKKYDKSELAGRIIVLQELIKALTKSEDELSFYNALIMMDAKYIPTKMHNAIFDAICLKDLFFKVCTKYEDDNPIMKEGILKLPTSNIYHTVNCLCIKDKLPTDSVLAFKDVVAFCPCKRCLRTVNPLIFDVIEQDEGKVRKIVGYKGKPVHNEEINEIADFFKLKIDKCHDYITVFTGYSFWRVYCEEGYVTKLKHENYSERTKLNNLHKNGAGFHNHEKFDKDIYSVFEYISIHDSDGRIRSVAEDMERKQKSKEKQKKQQRGRKIIEHDEWEKYHAEIDEYKCGKKLRKRM